jgi:hypothetical protein
MQFLKVLLRTSICLDLNEVQHLTYQFKPFRVHLAEVLKTCCSGGKKTVTLGADKFIFFLLGPALWEGCILG